MKTHQDPLKTTIKGVKNAVYVREVVQRIQNKIIDHGLCSEAEQVYLSRYCDHFEQIGQKNLFTSGS